MGLVGVPVARRRDATVEPIADLGRAASDLARFIAALQAIDPTGGPAPGEHNFFRGEALAARDVAVRASIAALRDEIDVDAVTAAWEAALRAPEWRRPPVWIHGDLDARNVLVEDGRLSAVIDWGALGVGDPACDVMVAWKLLSADTRGAFREALAIDDATWTRGRGWALSQALNALSYYTLETNAVLVREASAGSRKCWPTALTMSVDAGSASANPIADQDEDDHETDDQEDPADRIPALAREDRDACADRDHRDSRDARTVRHMRDVRMPRSSFGRDVSITLASRWPNGCGRGTGTASAGS